MTRRLYPPRRISLVLAFRHDTTKGFDRPLLVPLVSMQRHQAQKRCDGRREGDATTSIWHMRYARNLFYLLTTLPEVRHAMRKGIPLLVASLTCFNTTRRAYPSSAVLNTFWREREGAEEFTEARGQAYKVRLHFILYSIH